LWLQEHPDEAVKEPAKDLADEAAPAEEEAAVVSQVTTEEAASAEEEAAVANEELTTDGVVLVTIDANPSIERNDSGPTTGSLVTVALLGSMDDLSVFFGLLLAGTFEPFSLAIGVFLGSGLVTLP